MSSRPSFRWPDLSPGGYGGTIEAWEQGCHYGNVHPCFLFGTNKLPTAMNSIAGDEVDPTSGSAPHACFHREGCSAQDVVAASA